MPFRLIAMWFFWFIVTDSTVINAFVVWGLDSESIWDPRFIVPFGVLGIVFGVLAFVVSLRVARGPRKQAHNPARSYYLATLLAMLLTWFIHVFGGVWAMADAPRVAVLGLFFVPTWLLFLLNMPTPAKLARWTDSIPG